MKNSNKVYIGLMIAFLTVLSCMLVILAIIIFLPQETEEKAIAKISLDTRNAKSEFYIGEPFSAQGLGIAVTYVDGTEELVLPSDERCNIIEPEISKVGTAEVLVNLGNFTQAYAINVSRIDGLLLDLSDVNLVYEEAGDEEDELDFSINGLHVYLLTTSAVEGYTELQPFERELDISEYKVSEPDLTTVGSKTITVDYIKANIECNTTFEVCVLPRVDSMSQLEFNNPNGGKLTMYITERSGGSNSVTDGAASGWYLLERTDGTCSMYAMTTQYSSQYKSSIYGGDSAVQVRLSKTEQNILEVFVDGYTFNIPLSGFNAVAFGWPRTVTGYEFNYSAAKREYLVGDEFLIDGVKILIYYSDNNTDEISGEMLTVSQPDMNTAGVKTVEVSYTDAQGKHAYTYQIYCIPDVDWDTNRLDFGGDRNGSGDTLELFVTDRSNPKGWWGEEQYTTGWLLLKKTDGTYEMYEYSFRLDSDVSSHPYPDGNPEGVWSDVPKDGEFADNLLILINGRTFVATDNDYWHQIIFGWSAELKYQIDISEANCEYVVNDEFSYEGLKLLYNASEEIPIDEITVSEPDMSTIGVKTIVVTYIDDKNEEYTFTYQIYCIPDVDWDTNRLDFGGDRNGSGDTLELFVTERSTSDGWWGDEQYTVGWLLLKKTDGTYEMYEYSFRLDSDTTSHPYPDGNPEGVWSDVPKEGEFADNLVILINGRTFVATDNDYWHQIILGWSTPSRYQLDFSEAECEYLVNGKFSKEGLKLIYNSTEEIPLDKLSVSEPDMSTIGVKDIVVTYIDDLGEEYTFTYQIYCIPDVDWDTNRLDFGDDYGGSGSTLTLFVTERSTTPDPNIQSWEHWGRFDQRVKGWLLVVNAKGSYEMYEFDYYLDIGVTSHLYPDNNAPEGVNAYLEGDPLVIEIRDKKFIAEDAGNWHMKVIGWQ